MNIKARMKINNISGKYLLQLLPTDVKQQVFFYLRLKEEKAFKKNRISLSKDQETKILKKIIADINARLMDKKYDSSTNPFVFIIMYTLIICTFFAAILLKNEDGFTIVKKLIMSGTGHLFIMILLFWYFERRLRINIGYELSMKYIKPVELLLMFTSVIIISGMLFLVNFLVYRVPLQSPDNYFGLSLLLYPTVVPLTEELLFRRCIYRYLRLHLDVVSALCITSILFLAVHNLFSVAVVVIMFICSVIITLTYEINGNLIIPVIVHSLSNLSILLLKYFSP